MAAKSHYGFHISKIMTDLKPEIYHAAKNPIISISSMMMSSSWCRLRHATEDDDKHKDKHRRRTLAYPHSWRTQSNWGKPAGCCSEWRHTQCRWGWTPGSPG